MTAPFSSAVQNFETEVERDSGMCDGATKLLARKEEWLSTFRLRVRAERSRKHEHDLLLEAADLIATYLRVCPTMPPHPSDSWKPWTDSHQGGRLPPVSCAFAGCTWHGAGAFTDKDMEDDPEHPWDQQLRAHVRQAHGDLISNIAEPLIGRQAADSSLWDLYKQAIAVVERRSIPSVGMSVDRRVFEHLVQVYNDRCIRSLICFCCAQIKVDTGRCRSRIQFRTGTWLMGVPWQSLQKNFSMSQFERRYCKRTPLSAVFAPGNHGDVERPDFSDWRVRLREDAVEEYLTQLTSPNDDIAAGLRSLCKTDFLCCPQDQLCSQGCKERKELCLQCRVPICASCMPILQQNEIVPSGLANDNWYGYIQNWIYEVGVTWMGKTVSSPYWTGMTLFSVSKRGRRRHLMHDAMYQSASRVAFKGQVFSAPMDWACMQEQLENIDKNHVHISLPIVGQVLACRVQVQIASGLVDLKKCMREATVRRNVVARLIQMHKDSGHPDYQHVDMVAVVEKTATWRTPTNLQFHTV